MPIEIEKKYLLTPDECTHVVFTLEDSDATFTGEDDEENIIFTGSVLADRRAVLRIRRIGAKTLLTYKERLPTETNIKHQIEHETEVSDFDAALHIVEALGLTRSLVYEKRRKKWQWDDVEIVLDELPFGKYMEIEGPVESIRKAEKRFEIEQLETVHETYPQLTTKFGRQNGQTIEARFEKQ